MRRIVPAAALLALGLAALTACDAESAPAGTEGEAVDVSEYQEIADAAMADTAEWPGPVDGPAAATGIKAMFIACGFGAEGCKGPADAAVEAGEAIGWDVTVVDGQFDPQIYSRSISQAIDGDYDVVIINAITDAAVSEQIAAARAAGIIVGSLDGANVPSETGVTFEVDQPFEQQGINMASYMIAKTKGKANVALLRSPEFASTAQWIEAAAQTFEECATCTIAKDDQFTSSEADQRLPTLISSTLRQDPTVNVVVGSYDAALLSSIPTLAAEGHEGLLIGGFNGISPMIQFVRDGMATATSAVPLKWGTWAAFDNANRLLQGEEIVEQNLPTRLITVDNIDSVTSEGQWDGGQDYQAHFSEIWNG